MVPTTPETPSPKNKFLRGPIPYALGMLAILWLLVSVAIRGPAAEEMTTTEFEQALQADQIATATFLDGEQVVEGELANGGEYRASYPYDYQAALIEEVQAAGVPIDADAQTGSSFVMILVNFLPVLLIVGVLFYFMNQANGGGGKVMQFGKSKHKVHSKDTPKTSFDDIAGNEEAVEELMEIKEFLESPDKFLAMGAKIPRGVLLVGPPGTGKTLLARAVAGEAGVPFFSISGSDFVEMFVGVGASRVRDLFEQAKTAAPAIVFIDEIDAVGRHRGAGLGGGHDEREQTLNQLLVEMDGFDQRATVIVMAATNRPDILDPALLRPGRFDRQVIIDRPDLEGRKGILKVHAKGKPLAPDVDLDVVAKRTPGFTGADLANVINEGSLLAARRDKTSVTNAELTEAIDRVMAGPERKTRVMTDREKRMIAFHEGGHALVAYVLPNSDPVHKITVIPRGRALGYTMTLPEHDKFLMTREELTDELAMLLGGRVAEELVLGELTTGAQNDLERASKLARQMVTEYGMSDRLGPMTHGHKQQEVFLGRDIGSSPDYSPQVAYDIDSEVMFLIDRAHDEALEILQQYRTELNTLVELLLEKETLEKDEIVAIWADVPKRAQRDIGLLPDGGLATMRSANRRPQRDGAGPGADKTSGGSAGPRSID